MDRFQRGKIYSIRAVGSDMVYIGSTISTLTHRISCHRSDFKAHQAGNRRYITSFKLIELEGHYIELVENYPCADRNELNRREGQIIRETDECINKNIAGRTGAEYHRDNRESKLAYMKKYHQDNRETILTRMKQKFNCECGGNYTGTHKARHLRTQKHQAFINT